MLITQILLAFFEGLALIMSPCILPILPIILSGSLQGSKSKPFGIIMGFIFSFTLFTTFSRTVVHLYGIDLNQVRTMSLIFLVFFGLVMLSENLSSKFEWLTQRFANVGVSNKNYSKFEFINGLVFGSLIGIIWTPCAGPILAAVILQTVLQKTNLESFLLILAFSIGVGIPMMIITLFGNQALMRFQWLKRHGILLRKTLGLIIILSVVYILYGTIPFSIDTDKKNIHQERLIDSLLIPYPAPAIAGIERWINSKPLTVSQLKDKVVLIDFWAYSCINCVRTLPYLRDWYRKYHDKGLEIIGVHSPEFDFEAKFSNLQNAVKTNGILYPVALDNSFVTWANYQNSYWPAHYLINKKGYIVYSHFGEGNYDITENNIRFLLGLNKNMPHTGQGELSPQIQTPETYLGYQRANSFSSPEELIQNQPSIYSYPPTLKKNSWALKGGWMISSEKIRATSAKAAIKIHFQGKKVFAVMGNSSTNGPVKINLILNGKPFKNKKSFLVSHYGLYSLISLAHSAEGSLELIIENPGLELYTFTFN